MDIEKIRDIIDKGMCRGDVSRSDFEDNVKLVSTQLQVEIDKEKQNMAKKRFVCKHCWGKGYSTQWYGTQSRAGDTPKKVNIKFCNCDRGNQIKRNFIPLSQVEKDYVPIEEFDKLRDLLHGKYKELKK